MSKPQIRLAPAVSAKHFLIAARQSQLNSLSELKGMLQWVGATCTLIHQLQRERGLSNLFLASSGKLKSEERLEQVRASVKHEEALCILLESVYRDSLNEAAQPQLLNKIAAALLTLEQFHVTRKQIRALEIEPVDSTLTINRIIEHLLSIIFESAYLASDPKISESLTTLFHLNQAKELVGQERAWTSVGFARGYFVDRLAERIRRVIEQQQELFAQLREISDPRIKSMLEALFASSVREDLNHIRVLRDDLLDGSPVDANLADQWFAKCTDYMDEIQLIELAALDQVEQCCEQQIRATQKLSTETLAKLSLESSTNGGEDAAANTGLQTLINEQRKQIQSLTTELESAREALRVRKLVERAKEILKENLSVNDEQAYRQLQKSAMDQNCTLAEISAKIIDTYKRTQKR